MQDWQTHNIAEVEFAGLENNVLAYTNTVPHYAASTLSAKSLSIAVD